MVALFMSFLLLFFLFCPSLLLSPQEVPSENGLPKPIVPSTMAEAGRILPAGMDGGGEFGKLLGGLGSKMDQVGEKAMAKLREMKMVVPEKFQTLMSRAMEIFRESNGNEKEQWDKLIKSVESTKLTPEEKREFYEKVAAVTIQQIH